MPVALESLPRWDLTAAYPDIRSAEFDSGFQRLISGVQESAAFWDEHGIGKQAPATLDAHILQAFDQAIERWNALHDHAGTLLAYIYGYVSTDSRDSYAQAKLSEAQQQLMNMEQLNIRLVAWIGSQDVDALLARSAIAREHEYLLRRAQVEASHQMSPAEEALATELNLTGGSAWGLLHENLTSQVTAQVESASGPEVLPISVVRNLAFHADREVRRRAYIAELTAWEKAALPLAAAFNAIKGEDNVLIARRNWGTALEVALYNNHIDEVTLDAMMSAARDSFPDFRRYLKAKARALGLPIVAWFDIEAPVGATTKVWPFDEASRFIIDQFGAFSSGLRGLAERAFREHWIDAEPREGKRGGGFCMELVRDESRILVNYVPAFDGVSTLAHELGHAYHNLNIARRPPLLRGTPSTLAETASTFCETIIRQAGLGGATTEDRLALLEASISGQCQVVLDISCRFLFEQRAFEARHKRELAVEELNELMLQAQRDTYGDAVDQHVLHPYMWAVKGHYYSSWHSFYNFPYMFGQLFGLGLFARYQADPERFVARYDELLSSTGMADAVDLAAGFGIDIRSKAFWKSSLDVIRTDIDRFEALVDERYQS